MTGLCQDPRNAEARLSDQRFVRYIALSLRRYAARWRTKLGTLSKREELTLNRPIPFADGHGTEERYRLASQSLPADEDSLQFVPVEELIHDDVLYRAFQTLTARQRHVLVSLIINDERQQTVARRLNVTQQAVCRSKEQALRRLRLAARARG